MIDQFTASVKKKRLKQMILLSMQKNRNVLRVSDCISKSNV